MSDEVMSDDMMNDPATHAGAPREAQPHAGNGASRPDPPRHRLRTVVLSVLLLAAGAAVALAAVRLRPQPERHRVETPPPLVQVVRAVVEPVSLDVVSQGTVEPVTASSLVAQVAGRVTAVSDAFADGAFFRSGQVLLEIDRRDYELALRDAEAVLAQARVGLQREQAEADVARREWQELGHGGEPNPLVLHEPQLAQARASVAAAEAAVERARLDLERTRVSAPFAGRVRAKRADLGQYVTPGTPVADVFSTEAAEIRLPVSKDDLAYLDVGLGWSADGERSRAPVATLRGELAGRLHTWPARVVRTGAEIDPKTRMLNLFARVDDPLRRAAGMDGGAPLPMGLFVEARVAGRNARAAVLPRRALRTTERSRDDEVMVVDDDGRLRFRRVEVLRAEGDRIVVGAGLADGDRVVVSRLEEAVDGMRVRSAELAPQPEDEAGTETGAPPTTEGRL